MTDLQIRQITALWQAGYGLSQIAQLTALSRNTIKSYIQRHAVTKIEQADVLLCKQCQEPIVQKPKRKPQIFCCTRCKQTWWNHQRCHE